MHNMTIVRAGVDLRTTNEWGIQMQKTSLFIICLLAAVLPGTSQAFDLVFTDTNTAEFPVFSNVRRYSFDIPVNVPVAEMNFQNPQLGRTEYRVLGTLAPETQSGFPSFILDRSIIGTEVYNQGSSLSFSIAPGANLHDGLQVADLAGPDPVFVFNAREVNTGRYHPPLIELNSDGTGRILNSNNTGGINPANNQFVDVDFGEEYITALIFNATTYTLANITIDGDFDENNSFNCADVDALVQNIASNSNNLAYDLNNDGQLDFADVEDWLVAAGNNNIGSPFLLADANLDGSVDTSDFNIWNENSFTNTAAFCSGDFNGDGSVDGSDFNVWHERKFTSSDAVTHGFADVDLQQAGVSTQVVPEPSAFSLIAMMGMLMILWRRSR